MSDPTQMFVNTLMKVKKAKAQQSFDNIPVKQKTYLRIQKKKNDGYLLTKGEQDFEKKYLGIDEGKKSSSELGPEDRVRLRNLAKEKAKMAYGSTYQQMIPTDDGTEQRGNTVKNSVDPNDYIPSEADIQKYLPDAAKFLYPKITFDEFEQKADPAKPKTNPLDIQIPSNIKKASQALEHLMTEYGMDEEEGKAWIQERL